MTVTEPTPTHRRAPAPVRRALLAVAALSSLAMVALGTYELLDLAARHTTDERRTFPGVRALVVDGASDVRLTSARAGAPLTVVARITEGLSSPERNVQREPDGTLRLSSDCPGLFGGHCAVRYDIRVPSGTVVRAEASAGDMLATDLRTTEPLELSSSAGDVTAIGVSTPSLTLSSSAGDVRASGVQADRISVRSSAGDVSASLLSPAVRAGGALQRRRRQRARPQRRLSARRGDHRGRRGHQRGPDGSGVRSRDHGELERRRRARRGPPLTATARSRPSARSGRVPARRCPPAP